MKVAVVGSGIAGLSAAWHLRESACEVTLFEAGSRLGGHTHTVPVVLEGRVVAVDLGFIVFNRRTYPGLTRLFDELGVATRPSDMSFSVRSERSGLEYNGAGLRELFAQKRNLLRPSFYRMIAGILRFNRRAPSLLERKDEPTLGDFLVQERLPPPFVELYLVPMLSAVWSGDPSRMLEMPARSLARFLQNHGLLSVNERPVWRVVEGGSRRYVDAMRPRLGARIRVRAPVRSVRRTVDGVRLAVGEDEERFDHVILAVHSDQALQLLADPSPAEREILAAIPYQENEVVLHTDTRFLPHRRRARASWNYHLDPPDADGRTKVTYWMNRLQGLEIRTDLLVTLNRTERIDPASILHRTSFSHPVFGPASAAAQARRDEISGPRATSYAGAWWGHGFHEDGFQSGRHAAKQVLRVIRGEEASRPEPEAACL